MKLRPGFSFLPGLSEFPPDFGGPIVPSPLSSFNLIYIIFGTRL
jgi:hypothetical protein